MPAGQSLFLPPVAPPPAPVFAPSTATFANPFAVPTGAAQVAPSSTAVAAPQGRTVANRVAPATPERLSIPAEPDSDELWRARGFDAGEQQVWRDHGLRPAEAELADRCQAVGIAAEDLPRKLSGRTVLQRLRDGESSTSVWARIREAEQQPRKAGTKLTGRFQLS